jgi:pyrroloquinoline quinone biosynthesis protein B
MRLAVPALLLLVSCAAKQAPYLLVLGTAQDGGYPQLGCEEPLCRAAHDHPELRRHVASALIVDPRSGQRWLLDATPDLPAQLELARGHAGPATGAAGRPPLFDGIFLTHAHMGHYTGLMHLGRESYATEATPVYATERMGEFLQTNGPWSLLFDAGHLEHVRLVPGQPVPLAEDLSVTPFEVPHRPEFSDTVAFLVRGPNGAALFLPDIDKWERWDRPIEDLIAQVDVALLDGTFFDGDELPGRDMDEIPHPFIVESLERFSALPAAERDKVRFFHLNHSNPAVDPNSSARARLDAAGMHVAREGEAHGL